MIRLKHLVEDTEREAMPEVLFITDVESQRKNGFARKLISNGVINGDIEIYPTDNIIDAVQILHYNASTVDNLVVVYHSGRSDKSYLSVTQDLARIVEYAQRYDMPIALITIPTPRFIKKYDSEERLNAVIRNEKINKWILESSADYVIDLSKFTDDVFFTKNGEELSIQGNVEIYKQLVRILHDIDASIDVESEDERIDAEVRDMNNSTIRNLEDLQLTLSQLGYRIRYSEISKNKFGKTTKQALIKFKRDNEIFPHDPKITKETLNALNALINKPEEEEEVDLTGTVKYLGGPAADNIQLVIDYLNESGITNPYAQIGILCTIGKESGFEPQDEISYSNTPNDRIRQIFGDRVPDDDEELDALKSDDEAFFNQVYGGMFGNAPDEGYLYRGRGFNGLTFKGNYKKYGSAVGEDLVGDPERVNDPDVAAKVAVEFFTKGRSANSLPDFDNIDSAITYFVNLNAGGSGREADHGRAKDWADKFIIEH